MAEYVSFIGSANQVMGICSGYQLSGQQIALAPMYWTLPRDRANLNELLAKRRVELNYHHQESDWFREIRL